MHRLRVYNGLLIWTLVAGGLLWCAASQPAAVRTARERVVPQLWQHIVARRSHVAIEAVEPVSLALGDPVFEIEGGRVRQVGEVSRVNAGNGQPVRAAATTRARVLFYPGSTAPSGGDRLAWYATPDSISWVAQALLPPAKRQQVVDELNRAVTEHYDEMFLELQPLFDRSVQDALAAVEDELPAALARHKADFESLGQRYQHELLERELLPLVRREIWPVVRRRAEPTASVIGRELWQRLSVWRFSRALFVDKFSRGNKRRFEEEWRQFIDKEAVEVVKDHSDEIVEVMRQVIVESSRNPRIQAAARRSFSRVIHDTEVQQLLWSIVKETVVENLRLRKALKQTWTSPEAKRVFARAGDRIEPTARRISVLLIGSREGGITPEFAAVLRNQVLGKDRRWLVLERGPAGTGETPEAVPAVLPVHRGRDEMVNPFLSATATAR